MIYASLLVHCGKFISDVHSIGPHAELLVRSGVATR